MSVTQEITPAATTDSYFPSFTGGTCDAVLADNADTTYLAKQAYSGESFNSYGVSCSQIPSTGIASVVSVRPRSRWWMEGHFNTPHGGFRIGTNNYEAFGVAMGTDVDFSEVTGTTYATNPNTGIAWTVSDVNGLGWWTTAGPFNRDGDVIRCSLLHFVVTMTLNPPVPVTTPASLVTPTSATLNGTLDPNGATATYPVSYYFQWGLTTAYGNTTSTVSGVTGTGASGVSSNLTGLVANTTYHFRLVASNAEGTVLGSDQFFTTGQTDTVVVAF